jgi:hypothetical protein
MIDYWGFGTHLAVNDIAGGDFTFIQDVDLIAADANPLLPKNDELLELKAHLDAHH